MKRTSVGRQGLDALFDPETVAVIGATDRVGSVGRTVFENLLDPRFQGRTYPVNLQHPEVLGVRAYKSIRDLPEPIDLAVFVTPAITIPGLIEECVQVKAKSAVVISAGFKERGAAGIALEQQIKQQLLESSMRLIGPNCLGVMNPLIGMNATFAKDPPKAGNVAFLSQSGALLTAILDWSEKEDVGFSAIVSTGSMLDVGWGDLIYYFGDDPNTKSILIYMESVGDARSFLSAAREVALTKPIIVIKAGRSQAASKAAASHTGALTGSDEVLDAAFRRCGVLRVQNIADLFYMAEVLGKQPRPKGPRLTILTNAGGPGVLATDALVANGGELAKLSEQTLKKLNDFLPAHWSHGNPVDVLGDADSERYAKAIDVVAQDPNSDGLLVVLAPQGMTNPSEIAKRLKPYANSSGKPLLASWMGGISIAEGEKVLNNAGIPTFPYPDTAARAFTYMWSYDENLRSLYETPSVAEGLDIVNDAAKAGVEQIIQNARQSGRLLLDEFESKAVLANYGIPTVETLIARSEEEAVKHALQIGFPIVLKVFSATITHKTDVGGVRLSLQDESEVREAYQGIKCAVAEKASVDRFGGVTVQPMVKLEGYELILGSSVDPQFGPVLLFGSGGQLVEVYKDRALALPPLNTTLARRMMEQTQILKALKGVRGRKPVDLSALEHLVVRFSQLVTEQTSIAEIDINPLVASPEGLLALDARIVIQDPAKQSQVSKPAIRPYPTQYVSKWTTNDGREITIRPIRPEDEPLMAEFHRMLSDRTVYLRYFASLSLNSRIAHDRLLRVCFGDYEREMVLVGVHRDSHSSESKIVGVVRLNKLRRQNKEAETAVLISDAYQKQGLGLELLRRIIQVARDEKLNRVSSEMLGDNLAMQLISKRLGFRFHSQSDSPSLRAVLDL
jgi:acetyltransferase